MGMLLLVGLSLLVSAGFGSCLLVTRPAAAWSRSASAGMRRTERQTLPEHLIDCAANPVLADLYGGGGSPYCFQIHPGIFTGFGSILEQTLTIGFLVSSYFFFKRSQGGIIDWNETQVDEDEEDDYGDSEERDLFEPNVDDSPEFTEAFERMRLKRQRQVQRKRNCPQCGGSGTFTWTGPAKVCDMCVGTGTLDIPTSPSSTIGMRGSRALPPLISDHSPKDDQQQ